MGPIGPAAPGSMAGAVANAEGARTSSITTRHFQGFRQALDEASGTRVDLSKQDGTKIADAARQFEALMIGQILKAAHGSGSEGWLGAGDDDESSSTAIQVAEEYLGQAIANGGGLGIAGMVIRGVAQDNPRPANSGTMHANSTRSGTDPLRD